MNQFACQLSTDGGVVDVGPGAQRDLRLFALALSSAWPMDEASSFKDLLSEIDEAARGSAGPRPERIE
jgi:hypothetical protein